MADKEYWDKVQIRMLLDWSKKSDDLIIQEELQKLEGVVNEAVDEHYGDTTTLDLTTVTYEGTISKGDKEVGWTIDEEAIWNRIPGDTREEKTEFIQQRLLDEGYEET
jgi:hypothetical protein